MSQTAAAETPLSRPSPEPMGLLDDDEVEIIEHAALDTADPEKFIPITQFALRNKLEKQENWSEADYPYVKRLFKLLTMWRHQEYCQRLNELNQAYIPFSPDRDTVQVTHYNETEKDLIQASLVQNLEALLIQGNYQRVTKTALDKFFSVESPYGLNLKVDLDEFEEVLIFCRGTGEKVKKVRSWKKFFVGYDSHHLPTFQRLFLLLKLKPEHERLRELLAQEGMTERKAKKILKRGRSNLPEDVSSNHIYLKLFKNIPQTDLEMLFPNTRVDFRLMDKIKLGVTAIGGTIAGIAGMAAKLVTAFATLNIFALIGGVFGLVGLAVRQVMKFFNQRTEYMMELAQNLYFHSLADNRGVITLMCDRAEEEDIKEELLLYTYLNQYTVPRLSLSRARQAIEAYLSSEFKIVVDYDIFDALERLERDGLIIEENGKLRALPPAQATQQLEALWEHHLSLKNAPLA